MKKASFLWQYCGECKRRLEHATEIPSRCNDCVAKREPKVARERARAALLVQAYQDGFEGRPRAKETALYVQSYRLGSRRRASGCPAASFTLYGATSADVVAA